MKERHEKKLVPVCSGILFISYLLFLLWKNEVPTDTGDGLVHFKIAKDSWLNSGQFLDHWGKPLFTLFASPFAQFGYISYIFFNIVVVALILLFSALIFRKLKVSSWMNWLLVLTLASNYEWMKSVLGGLTEPFFGLLVVLLLWGAINRKWIFVVVIAGFTPFARGEGMLVMGIIALLLIAEKQYKSLPLLFLGFVVYGFFGYVTGKGFWWYFTENPYGKGNYGHGSWDWYIANVEYWLSPALLLLIPVAVFGAMIARNRKWYLEYRLSFIAVLLIFLLIVAAHSWFWYSGTMSSLGLLRLATLAMPAATLVLLICVDVVVRELGTIPKIIALLLFSVYSIHLNWTLGRPLKANAFEVILIEAAQYASRDTHPVYYHHPLVQWAGKRDFEQLYFAPEGRLPDSSLIIRDPQFGSMGMQMPFDVIDTIKWLSLEKVIKAREPYEVYTHEPTEIRIYRVRNK